MMCPYCGKFLSPTARMCPNCGHEFPSDSRGGEEGIGCFAYIIMVIISFLIAWLLIKIFLRGDLFLVLFG